MANMTDLVNEGLKYPFNDIKRILSFGVLFTLLSIVEVEIGVKFLYLLRFVEESSKNFSTINSFFTNDVYIIALFSVICFIISLLIMGYQYNVLKFSITKNNDLPGFNVLNLLKNGVKYFIVSLVYNIIPIIVLIASLELLPIYSSAYLLAILAFILFIICNFLQIMALSNMVDTDKFAKAFDLRDITDKIANIGLVRYIRIILFTLLIYAIILIVTNIILMLFTSLLFAVAFEQVVAIFVIIVLIEGLLIFPYIGISLHRVYGSIYRESKY